MAQEIGLREARTQIGDLANLAHLAGEITYLTRHGERIAAVVPLDRIKEKRSDVTYTLTTDEGTETIQVIRDGEEVREIYTVDGDVCDDSIMCDERADEYLARRDAALRANGWVTA